MDMKLKWLLAGSLAILLGILYRMYFPPEPCPYPDCPSLFSLIILVGIICIIFAFIFDVEKEGRGGEDARQ